MRFVCLAMLLAASTALADGPERPNPGATLDPSVLHRQQPLVLSPPVTGLEEPKKGVRTITIRPDSTPAPAVSGRYYVQLTAQHTSREAQDRFDEMRARFSALSGHQAVIMRTDAGVSTVYRAMVGPFADLAQANEMCGALQAQGGPCVVQTIE